MANNIKFFTAKSKSAFQKHEESIPQKSITFIEGSNEIYADGQLYSSVSIPSTVVNLDKGAVANLGTFNGQNLSVTVNADNYVTGSSFTSIDVNKKNQIIRPSKSGTIGWNSNPSYSIYNIVIIPTEEIDVQLPLDYTCDQYTFHLFARDALVLKMHIVGYACIVEAEYVPKVDFIEQRIVEQSTDYVLAKGGEVEVNICDVVYEVKSNVTTLVERNVLRTETYTVLRNNTSAEREFSHELAYDGVVYKINYKQHDFHILLKYNVLSKQDFLDMGADEDGAEVYYSPYIIGSGYMNYVGYMDYIPALQYVKKVVIDGVDCGKTNSLTDGQHTVKLYLRESITDFSYLFYYNYSILYADFSNFDMSRIKSCSAAFAVTPFLTSINFEGCNTSSLVDVAAMFEYAVALTSLDLSSFDTSNVTDMSYMFACCENMAKIDVSSFRTNKVTDMSSMFDQCIALEEVDVSSFNTSYVENMQWMFYQCENLKSLDLSSFNFTTVKYNMSDMMSGCSNLSDITVRSKIETTSYSRYLFNGVAATGTLHTTLSNNYFANSLPSGWTLDVMENYITARYYVPAESDRVGLPEFDLSADELDYTSIINPALIEEGMVKKFVVDGKDVGTNNTLTEGAHEVQIYLNDHEGVLCYTFIGIASLTYVDLSNFDSSLCTQLIGTFQYTPNLTSINMRGFNTSNAINLSLTFAGTGLQSFDGYWLDTRKMTVMSYAFAGLFNAEYVDVSSFDTSNCIDFMYMFMMSQKLKKLDLSNFNIEKAESCSSMFAYSQMLEDLTIYTDITSDDKLDPYTFVQVTTTGTLHTNREDNIIAKVIPETWGLDIENYIYAKYYVPDEDDRDILDVYNEYLGDGVEFDNILYSGWFDENSNLLKRVEIDGVNCGVVNKLEPGAHDVRIYFNGSIDLGYLFYNNAALTYVDFSKLKAKDVGSTGMAALVGGCINLTSANFKGLETFTPNNLGMAFAFTGLVDLDLTPINTSQCESMQAACAVNIYAQSIDLTGWDFTNVYACGSMFYGCTSLTAVTLYSTRKANTMIVDAMFGEIETTGTLTTNCKTSAFAVNIPSTWKLNIDNYILARYYVFEESERPDYSDRLSIESFSIPLEHNAIVSSAALSGEDVPAYIQKLVVDGSNVGTNNTLTTGEHEVKIYLKDDVATLFSLFTGVTSLTHVDFSRFDSSIITGEYADYGMMATFAGAMNLSSINFSGLDTSAFKQFVMSFVDTSLTTLDLSSLDLSNVEAAVYMISLNNLLTSVDFGTNTFSNCQAFDCFMYGNMALESLDISNFDMSSVSSCTNMLIYNIALKSAKLFSWTPAQDIGGCLMGMFYGCSSLPEVDLSGCDFSNITSTTAFDAMFGDCSNLSKVTVFSSYNGIAHEQMFENVATTGTLITDNTSNTFALSAPSTWSVITSYIDIQLNNTSNTQVFSSTAYSNLRSYIAGMTVDGQDVNISNYPEIPATSSIATYSARASYPVIRVYFKDTINTINLYRLFYNQSNISSVDMSHFKLLNIKNMQEMFYNASNLTNINITGLNTCYATLGSHMFRSCKNLRNIEGVTNLDMSSITTLNAAFYECAALTEVDLSGWTTSKALTDMGHMFNGCTTLKTVVLPEITDASVTTIGSIFNNCKALESVDLSPVNLEAVTDATNVFNACSNLTEVTVNTTVSSATVTSMFTGVASSGTLNASNNSNIFVDNVPSGWKVEVPSYMTIEIKSGASSLFNSSGYSNISKYIKKITVNDTNVTISNSPNLPNDINTIVIHFKNFDQSVSLSRLFYDNTYITSIDLSEFNASNVTKMSSMFYGCSSLTSLDLSNLDTSKVTDMYSMFYDCSSLTSLDLDSFDFSKVTEMTFMFCGCTSLTSLTVNTDVTSVSSSSYMFYDITTSGTLYTNSANNIFAKNVPSTWTVKLPSYMTIEIKGEAGCLFFNGAGYKSIANYIKKMTVNSENVEVSRTPNLPNDTNTVVVYFDEFNEDIILWNLFCDNKYITSVDLSNFDASKVVNMGYMFTSCTSLASLNLSNLDTSNVTDMSFMFYTCSELTSLDLSSFDFNKVTGISSIFRKCTSLTSLTVNTDITSVSSSSKIFDGVTTSGTLYTNSSDNIFAKNVPSTWTVKLSNYITLEIKSGASYIFYSSAYSNISSYIKKMIVNDEEVEISNTPSLPNDSNTVVVYFNKFKEDVSLRYLFYKGTSITNIDLSNFNTSNVTDMSYMFYYCSSLTSLNLSNLDTSNVTNMYSMFSGCSKLTSLDVSSFNTSKVTNMGYMFNSCSLLTSLDVSSFNTSKVTNMGYMFGSCSLLTLFDLSKFDTSKVIDMGAMFAHCKLLTSLNLSNFDTSNTTEMQSLFYNCSSLTSLDLSNFNFSKVVNIYYIFYNCTSLTSLTVNTNVTSMSSSSNMFGNITTTGKLYTNSSTNIFAVNKPSTWSISLI